MEVDRVPVASVGKVKEDGSSGMVLSGIWLTLARMIWLAWAAMIVVLLVAGIPAVYRQVTIHEAPIPAIGNADMQAELLQLNAAQTESLQALGFSLGGYAIYRIAWHLVIALLFGLVAAVIFWRKSANGLAFLASLTLLSLATAQSWVILFGAVASQPWLLLPVRILTSSAFPLLILFLFLFPNGRFVPSWTRIPSIIGIVTLMAWDVTFNVWGGPLDGLLMYVLIFSSACAQIYRYLRVSSPIQRQQTKWVVFGAAIAILGEIVFAGIYPALVPVSSRPHTFIYFFVEPVISYALAIFIPLSIGFSILRYRLYDIDLIIRRTLVYGMLTATLALIYWSGVVGLQALLRPITGPGNDFAIVASTLLIAALFLPLRQRIQGFIDRRFYRRKYNAAKTLAAFSHTARDEVELDRLAEKLVAVVEETMQPAHVSLWLRSDAMPKRTALQAGEER
jgi:hypothetical protein